MSSSPPTAARAAFRPQRALVWVGSFGLFGLAVSSVYATTGLGIGCPFRTLTGWECPFCGGTRLGVAMLHGDLAAAFAFNPLVFVGLVVLGLLATLWVVEWAGGPKVRPPRWVGRIRPTSWLTAAVVVAAGFTLLRNLI